MKVIFFGTPDFAVPSLKAIFKSKHEVLAVVTQPDRPVGRKAVLTPSCVKACATELGIEVLQYENVSKEAIGQLRAFSADIFVTCAFGQMLSQELLDIPKFGVINVHASLLPKYRGASPIQHAVINGDCETGVTIMKTVLKMDAGDIISVAKTAIGENETSEELFERLSMLGAKAVVSALDDIENGSATYTPQCHEKATFVKQIKKTDAIIDFSKDCKTVKNLVRGMQSWPCAYTFLNGKMLKIFSVDYEICNGENLQIEFGKVVCADIDNGIKVQCNGGAIKILELQLEGGKRMFAKEFLLGRKINIGDILG